MADIKYAQVGTILVAWDADFEDADKAREAGKPVTRFDSERIGQAIKTRLFQHGIKVTLQQRTSGLRGKATLTEVLDAMGSHFENWVAGNWETERTGAEAKKPLLVSRLVWCLKKNGNPADEGALTANLLMKKVEELETLVKHPKIAGLWPEAQEKVTAVQRGDDDLLGL